MSSYVFDDIKNLVAKGQIVFEVPDNTFYLALVNEEVFMDFTNGSLSNSKRWSDISDNEINASGSSLNNSGYEIRPLLGVTVDNVDVNGFTHTIVKAADVNYQISTIDAYGAVIFKNDEGSVNPDGSHNYDGTLINAIDFGERVSSNNGVYTIKLSEGFLNIK